MKIIVTLLSLSLLLTACTNKQVPEKVILETQEILPIEEVQNIEGDLYYIKSFSTKDNTTSIEIDKVDWLSFTDNTCSTPPEIKEGMPQCNPNGFLIQNSSPDLKIYEVLPSVSIQTTAFGTNPPASTKISLQDFNDAFASQPEYFELSPFVVQIENGTIIAIQEKYIP